MGNVPARVTAAVLLGTLLNPLNSSMIAVALVPLQSDFHSTLTDATWLLSGFYIAAAVAQPLMGRLGDEIGPRRVFLGGLVLVGGLGLVAPFAPSLGWLVAIRVLQAFGSSTAYPAGLALMRRISGSGRLPAAALAALSVGGSVSAALGPTIGGFLLALVGWRGIFLVNAPLALAGILMALRWLPGGRFGGAGGGVAALDLPGAVLFAVALAALLGTLLSAAQGPELPLLAVAVAAAALLAYRELNVAHPFLDLRMLAGNRLLVGVYLQFAAVTLTFYSVFYGVPIWLEQVRGLSPRDAGLVVFPITGVAIVVTPFAARLSGRRGPRPALVIGSAALLAGCLSLQLFGPAAGLPLVVAACLVLGLPNGFNNMGLQAALYSAAPAAQMGAAAGQFQTFRYLGAILSASLLGIVYPRGATTAGLHTLSLVLAAVCAVLVAASLLTRRGPQPEPVVD